MIGVVIVIVATFAIPALLAALSRAEERRARRRLSTPEKWARIATGGAVRWK